MNINPRPFRALAIAPMAVAATLAQSPQTPADPVWAPPNAIAWDSVRTNWNLGGSARVRVETRDAYALPGQPGSADFRARGAEGDDTRFLERLRLHAGHDAGIWSIYAEGQGSLAQSDRRFAYANSPAVPGTTARVGSGPEADAIDLHQAYLGIGKPGDTPVTAKVGRMELSYGGERLVGAFAWNNIGRSFDAVKLRWQNTWVGADAFVSHPVVPRDGRFDGSNSHDVFSGMYATLTALPVATLDLYFLARDASAAAAAADTSPQFPQPGPRDVYTLGFRAKTRAGELGSWDVLAEAAHQFGSFTDKRPGPGTPSGRLEQSASMAGAQIGYTFRDTWSKPSLSAGVDYSSGDSDPLDGKHGTFDNLFPTNHRFFGYMDLISLENMRDIHAGLSLHPFAKASLLVEGHRFWLSNTHDSFYNVAGIARGGIAPTAGTGYGVNPGYSDSVGSELSVIAGYTLHARAQLELGYGHFFAGDYIRQSLSAPTVGARDANLLYAQLSVTF